MSLNCEACEELLEYAPELAAKGVTDSMCTSLSNDTGYNPSARPIHNDAPDFHDANDCLVGNLEAELETYDVCDWQDFMSTFISNQYTMNKSLICSMGGIWEKIHDHDTRISSLEARMTQAESDIDDLQDRMSTAEGDITNLKNRMTTVEGDINSLKNRMTSAETRLGTLEDSHDALQDLVNDLIAAIGGGGGVVPVIRRYRFTVPANAFGPVWRANNTSKYVVDQSTGTGSWLPTSPDGIVEWFSGAGDNQQVGEMWIRIPTTEMENITGVWTQTWVVPEGNPYDGKGKSYVQSVNVQEWYRDGSELVVNFDTYIISPIGESGGQNGGPYPVTIDFLVVGTRTLT